MQGTMQCKGWTKKEKNTKRKRRNRERGREKEPQRDKESNRQENQDWRNGMCKTGSQEKKIPGTRCKLGNLGPMSPDQEPSQRKPEQTPVAPSACQGPRNCQTLGAGPPTNRKPGLAMVMGGRSQVAFTDFLSRQFLEARPPSKVAEDSGLGALFHPASRRACT